MPEILTRRQPVRAAQISQEHRAAVAAAGLRPGGDGAECSADTPTVLYIAGSGRSGSTLLERVLGEMPGFVNVGELIDLFRRTASANERCGCGRDFRDCPFWADVGARAFGSWGPETVEAVHRLQIRVARQRRLPRLLGISLAGHAFRGDVVDYADHYARLYRAIAAAADARYVVDASKWPVQALALRRGGLDIRVIHLVRDARGVAYSLAKRDVVRPHATDGVDLMAHSGAAGAAARWVACQAEAEMLRRCGLPVARVRYEDFVRQPREVVAAALAALGLPREDAQIGHIKGTALHLSVSHGLSGNPARFQDGTITLSADEAWRRQMSARDRTVVTAISLPLMMRYGLSRRADPGGKRVPGG